MTFAEAEGFLDSLGVDAMKSMAPSRHRIEALCAALDHPERSFPSIHITGTNGKTSTARIATALLAEAGLSVGTYTSPHLQTVRERLNLNGEAISEGDFSAVFEHIKPYVDLVEKELEEPLTYFEILTGMFFLWAAEAPVEAAVVEVGLGGLWDATNVIDAPVAVITQVGLDHTGLLGTTREAIAREKAGIIKAAAAAITGERTPGVLEVIGEQARTVGASVSVLDHEFSATDNRVAVGGRLISIETSKRRYEDLYLPLHGSHQGTNATLALEAVTKYLPASDLSDELVGAGFAATTAPGRLEVARRGDDGPIVVLDVAHNPDGTSALVAGLLETFAFERAFVVLGILGDKDYQGMLGELTRLNCELLLTEPKSMRSVPLEELARAAGDSGLAHRVVEDVGEAVDAAVGGVGAGELVCITGSHYVVGEARNHLGLSW